MQNHIENGEILKSIKEWGNLWVVILKIFMPFFVNILIISLLFWIYNTVYDKLGIDKVIISGVVFGVFYLNQINSNIKRWK